MVPVPAFRRPLGLALFLALLAGSAAVAAPSARSRALELERLVLRPGPSLALSTVYQALPPAQRQALLGRVRDMLLAQLPPGIEDHPGLAALPPETQAALKRVLPLLEAVTPAQLDAFVKTQDLDHLAPVPTEVFRLYHDKARAEAVPGGDRTRAAVLAADRAAPESWAQAAGAARGYLDPDRPPPEALVLLGPEDAVDPAEVPRESVKPGRGGLGVSAEYPLELPPHVLASSARLATALNHLAGDAYRDRPLVVRAAGREARVRTGVELVNALLATGAYEAMVFDARMHVDFVDLAVPHAGAVLPVRVPTWFRTGVDPAAPDAAGAARGELLLPGNHSEHLLVLYQAGTDRPAALVKWYMGIPGSGPQQGTFFKAAVWQRSSWCGYRIVRAYQDPAAARQLVDSATRLMRLFNFLQDRYRLPWNGYGVLGVCNDTTGLMEVVLQGRTGRSSVWPLIRDPEFDFYYAGAAEGLGLRLVKGAADEVVLDVPSDARPDHYPWVKDRRVLLYRIGANVPFREPAEVHFPELRGALEALAARSGYFAHGLRQLSVDQ